MQRSGSVSGLRTRRTRRRVLGLAGATAVHLLAVLALLPAIPQDVPDRSDPSDASAPLVIVQLVHLRPQENRAASPPQPQPESAPRPKSVSLPEDPAPFDLALSDPEAPGPSAPTRPEDNEALYRVPFRDAVAQADARLRAGLGCAHVDLQQLPKTVFDLCSAMTRPPKARG